jgi:hypothetical protein
VLDGLHLRTVGEGNHPVLDPPDLAAEFFAGADQRESTGIQCRGYGLKSVDQGGNLAECFDD